MSRQDRTGETGNEPQRASREPRERKVAPPVEREHETQEGALEDDEKRERKSERKGS